MLSTGRPSSTTRPSRSGRHSGGAYSAGGAGGVVASVLTGRPSRPGSAHEVARVGDGAGHGAGRDGERAGQVDLRLLVAHPPGEVAVGPADAGQRGVEP